MTRTATNNRLAWKDRWSQPSLPQLLDPLKLHHRRLVDSALNQLGQFQGLDRTILWYGPAWKWTIHYTYTLSANGNGNGNGSKASKSRPAATTTGGGGGPITLAYVVPRIEGPLICIPLSDKVIDQLPMTRLSKFIRDGIHMSKCAVAIHWAVWTPATLSEVEQIVELAKRCQKLALGHKEEAEQN